MEGCIPGFPRGAGGGSSRIEFLSPKSVTAMQTRRTDEWPADVPGRARVEGKQRVSCCSSNAGPFGRSVVFHCDILSHFVLTTDRIYDLRKLIKCFRRRQGTE